MSLDSNATLLPCPFCGAPAERIDIEDGENAGGSCVSCTRCLASSNVEFGFKENFVGSWNARSQPSEWVAKVPVEAITEARNLIGREIRSLTGQGLLYGHPVITELESHMESLKALLPSPPEPLMPKD